MRLPLADQIRIDLSAPFGIPSEIPKETRGRDSRDRVADVALRDCAESVVRIESEIGLGLLRSGIVSFGPRGLGTFFRRLGLG